MSITTILQIVLAVGLLFLGRRLYWGFVGAIGFIAVTEWALAHFQAQPEWVALLLGLAVGVIGAVLAIFLRAVGIGLAGFLGGAYLFMSLATMLEISDPIISTVLTVVGGILGLIFILSVFDWALIVISAVSGAVLISKYVHLEGGYGWLLMVGLAVVGMVVQASNMTAAE